MLIDTHCHLTDEKFGGEVGEVVERAREMGVKKIIVPATGEDIDEVVELTKKYEGVYGVVGVHPEQVQENINFQDTIFKLKELISNNPKIMGIGEVGMDFYWDKEKKTAGKQKELFRAQLELAAELNLPVVIHSRGAGEEIREVLEGLQGSTLQGQFHCFGESEEFLEYVLGRGFYVSFCGNVTYTSAEDLRKLAKMVPADRLLLETDAPYLAPEPVRGSRNEPANVKITAEFLAKLRGVTLEELERQTTRNTERLFGI